MNQTTPAIHALSFYGLDFWPISSAHLAARQAAFDAFVVALRKQGQPAMRDGTYDEPGCTYFDPATGNRCGIGHLVAPVYVDKLEGMNWCGVARRYRKNAEALGAAEAWVKHIDETYGLDSAGNDLQFLSYLQSCHDSAATDDSDFAVGFERRAERFAEQWGLTMPAKE